MIGDACRHDRVTNSARPITLTPKATRILIELQPQPDPCTRARVSAPMATISNSPPQRSGTRVSTECLMFGAKMAAATSAAIPMGMFRTKIHRHDAWTSSPPSAGPAAAPREPLTAQIWMECFRRSAGIALSINPRLVGTNAAAPSTSQAAKCEDREPEKKRLFDPVAIGQPASRDEQGGEDYGVRGEDPAQ